MKLVVFGLSVTSAWGNGHATLWRGLLRALAADGHRVVFFEKDTPHYAAHRDHPDGEGYDVVVYPGWKEIAPRAAREVAGADVAMVTSFCGDARAACELVLRSRAERVYYDLDAPVTLDALARGDDVPYLPEEGLGGFDLVLSYTGGEALIALQERLGARRTAPLYGSVDLATHGRGARHDAFVNDLSYLGTYAEDRHATVERLFLETARARPAHRFLLGGPMYPPDRRRPANVTWLPHVAPPDHPAFYGSSRLTLNVTRGAMASMGYCPSGRLFEAAACGAPIVSDAWTGLDEFFEPDREILVARSTGDVLAALSLGKDELATLARRARERVLAEHTAVRRARELVTLVTRSAAPSVRKTLRTPRSVEGVTCDRRARRTSRG
jgi:spore maturation protein CgeB